MPQRGTGGGDDSKNETLKNDCEARVENSAFLVV